MTPRKKRAETPAEGVPTRATLLGKVHTDESGGIYTDIGKDYPVIYFPKEDFRRFRKDYSKGWGGRALNQEEIATKWGFPDVHAVSEFVRVHGLRHTSDPFTDAELDEKGLTAAIDEAVLERRQGYKVGYRNAERAQLEKDAVKWHRFEDSMRAVLGSLALSAPARPRKLKLASAEKDLVMVFGVSDLHWGKLCYRGNGELSYDRVTARQRLEDATDTLLRRTSAHGRIGTAYYLVGSDALHYDSRSPKTTGGTMLAGSSDPNYAGVLAEFIEVVTQNILTVLQAVDHLVLVGVPGNHDHHTAVMLFYVLQARFREYENVSFIGKFSEPRVYVNHGELTFQFSHGDKLKMAKLHEHFLAEPRKQGLTLGRTLISVSGHIHHAKDMDADGIDHIVIPSLSEADDYHQDGGWTGSRPAAAAYLYATDGEKVATIHARAS